MSWEDRSSRVDHESGALLWSQVADDLRKDIESGVLRGKLPSEIELAEIYGVARVTIRSAVAHLRELGLVSVTVGRGTFVVKK